MLGLPICHHHNEITQKTYELLKLERRNYTNIDALLSDTQKIAKDILESADKAKWAGISMENRLKLYKKAIEGLGFERKKVNQR
jgi:hypothetical protein